MKNIIPILLLILSFTTYGQICETVNGKQINCVDSAGLRQGYWELTKKKVLVSGHEGLGSQEGCQYFEKVEYYPLSKGQFKNDRKIGMWEYYTGDKLAFIERKILYHEDGSMEDTNLADKYKITISHDKLLVKGQYYHNLDTIQINCKDLECMFYTSKKIEFLSFPFTDIDKLELELDKLTIGIYDREIRTKMNTR